jgi:hypothetical protein
MPHSSVIVDLTYFGVTTQLQNALKRQTNNKSFIGELTAPNARYALVSYSILIIVANILYSIVYITLQS